MSKRYMIKICYQEDDLSFKTVRLKKLKTRIGNTKELAKELQYHTDFFKMLGIEKTYVESTPYGIDDTNIFWDLYNKAIKREE